MAQWEDDCRRLNAIGSAASVDALTAELDRIVVDFDGTGFSIAEFTDGGATFVRGLDSGLDGWVEHYAENDLAKHCAIARRLAHSRMPFTWDEARRQSVNDERAQAVLNAAGDFGLEHGSYFPMSSRLGSAGFGFIKLSSERLAGQSMASLALVAVAAHCRLKELGGPGAGSGDRPLSDREADILTWFAEGKSAQDIADIRNISMATVMFHYRNVAERYGTLNRTHTLVEAMRRGHLRL